jgi:hypothetical protein
MEEYYKKLHVLMLSLSQVDKDPIDLSIGLSKIYKLLDDIYQDGYNQGLKNKVVKMDLN